VNQHCGKVRFDPVELFELFVGFFEFASLGAQSGFEFFRLGDIPHDAAGSHRLPVDITNQTSTRLKHSNSSVAIMRDDL
jgi:hypothetical protein